MGRKEDDCEQGQVGHRGRQRTGECNARIKWCQGGREGIQEG